MLAINVKNLVKTYGDSKALDCISFRLEKGEIVGFLGPNGAGKTTTMKILTCFMPATSGEATVAGHDCYENPLEVRKKIGYLPENAPLYSEMNVWEYLEYIGGMHGLDYRDLKKQIKEVIGNCGLHDKTYSEIGELSKGYKQRVGLAQALIHNPEILILDEPTTGLDPNQRIEIRELIKHIGKEKTVLLSSHILPEVEAVTDRVIIINQGKIVASGSPQELQKTAKASKCINIVVEGDEGDCKRLMERVNGIISLKALGKKANNEHAFEIFGEIDADLRKPIIKVFGQSRSTHLLEIYRKEITLEDVFTTLTKQ